VPLASHDAEESAVMDCFLDSKIEAPPPPTCTDHDDWPLRSGLLANDESTEPVIMGP